jgi:hypothetical protein
MVTMIAPPGIPACWLESEPCEVHVHFSHEQAETPHTHYFLIDLTLATASQPYPFPTFESLLFVLLLALSGLLSWQKRNSDPFNRKGWNFPPAAPPPKPLHFAI